MNAGSKYIINRVQQLFGKDAKDRFIIMCTFCDDKTPQCVEVINKVVQY